MESYPLLLFLFLFASRLGSSSSSIDSFVYGGCWQLKYAPGSTFQSNLNSLLSSIDNSATFLAYNNITVPSTGGDDPNCVYGLYQCRGDIGPSDCASCVQHAVGQLGLLCLDATGGTMQLEGCYIKYDNVTIVGVQDKSLVMKRCGPDFYSRPSDSGDEAAKTWAITLGVLAGVAFFIIFIAFSLLLQGFGVSQNRNGHRQMLEIAFACLFTLFSLHL